MKRLTEICAVVVLGSAIGCMHQAPLPWDVHPEHAKATKTSVELGAEGAALAAAGRRPTLADMVGLPPLLSNHVARGATEYRFAMECGSCLPVYLVRMRRSASGNVVGEIYLQWFAQTPALLSDTSHNARSMRTPPAECDGPLHPTVVLIESWCRVRIQPATNWARVLAALDSLRVTQAGGPPADEPQAPTGLQGCADVGDQELTIEVLAGSDFRRHGLWCLEGPAPAGSERARFAEARRRLTALIDRRG